MTNRVRIGIFASGAGSNAERLMAYCAEDTATEIALIVVNNQQAGVIATAQKYDIRLVFVDKISWQSPEHILATMRANSIDIIVLAGFLWRIPSELVTAFPNKIINLHPALLPKFGGKGMYGMHVHRAVVAAHEIETGITIHFANENYDEGGIIAQYKCSLTPEDTPETVAQKIRALEEKYFVPTILSLIPAI